MISTKEQYEELQLKRLLPKHGPPMGSDDHKAVFETIEALREVARAGDAWSKAHKDPDYAHCNTKYCVTSDQVRDAVAALPDWLTE